MNHPDPANPAPDTRPPGEARRAMLRTLLWGGGVVGIGGLAGLAISRRLADGGPQGDAAAPRVAKPALGPQFTYDVSRFQKTDPALVRYREVRRFASGVERPRALAVAEGAVWVGGAKGVRRLTEKGELMAEIATPQAVCALAVRKGGGLLVGQEGGIRVLDAAGAEVAHWKDLGAKFLPTAIALAGDAVFVADAGGRVVLKLDAKGAKLLEIGARDGGPGFVVPSPYFCARMAPDGLLRVANPGEHRIEAYTMEGQLELAWGKGSFAIDGFCGCCNPVSFEVLADGSFITCEKGLPRVKIYDSHGGFVGVVAGPEEFPEYLDAANAGTLDTGHAGLYAAAGSDGTVLVLDGVGGSVRVMELLSKEDPS